MSSGSIINCHFPNQSGLMQVSFENGLITNIAEHSSKPATGTLINADGACLLPGLIDCYARLREPGYDASATIASESSAAARAGFTTVMCAPDTDPVTDEPAIVEQIKRRATEANATRILPIGAMTSNLGGEQLSELFTLNKAGCVAFSNGDKPIANTQVLRRVMEYAASFDLRLIIAPQDPWLSVGVAHEGSVSTRLGLTGVASAAETVALSQLIELGYQTGTQLHFSRLSTERGVSLVNQAKRDGIKVTADVGIHHLFLSEIDVSDFNSNCHTMPPFRTIRDMDALRQGLADGVIDAICSNHAPHDQDSKRVPYSESQPGTSSIDGIFSLALRLHNEANMSLDTVISKLTTGPAECFNLPQGTIAPGAPADFCLARLDDEWELSEDYIFSSGKNNPCADWCMQGLVVQTIVAGESVFKLNQDAS